MLTVCAQCLGRQPQGCVSIPGNPGALASGGGSEGGEAVSTLTRGSPQVRATFPVGVPGSPAGKHWADQVPHIAHYYGRVQFPLRTAEWQQSRVIYTTLPLTGSGNAEEGAEEIKG